MHFKSLHFNFISLYFISFHFAYFSVVQSIGLAYMSESKSSDEFQSK